MLLYPQTVPLKFQRYFRTLRPESWLLIAVFAWWLRWVTTYDWRPQGVCSVSLSWVVVSEFPILMSCFLIIVLILSTDKVFVFGFARKLKSRVLILMTVAIYEKKVNGKRRFLVPCQPLFCAYHPKYQSQVVLTTKYVTKTEFFRFQLACCTGSLMSVAGPRF